jgi:hypothetical protein
MAPVVGLVAATAWHARDRYLLYLMTAVAWIMLLSHTLQSAYPHTALAMAKPFACLVLFGWLAWIAIRAPSAAARAATHRPASSDR